MIKTEKINRKNKCGVIIDARKIKTEENDKEEKRERKSG